MTNPESTSISIPEIETCIKKSEVSEVVAAEIRSQFTEFAVMINNVKSKALAIVVTKSDQTELMAKAREMRLALVPERTNAEGRKKALKADTIKYNKAIDGVWRYVEKSFKEIEGHLKLQEDFNKIREAEAKQKLGLKRFEEILPYLEEGQTDITPESLSQLSNDIYTAVLNQRKSDIEAAAEQERLDAENREKEERAAKRLRNRKDAILKIGLMFDGSNYVFKDIVITGEDVLNLSDTAFNGAIKKAGAEKVEVLKKMAEAKDRLEKLEKKQAAEEEARLAEKANQEEAERKEAESPDKEKLFKFADAISNIPLPELTEDKPKGILKGAVVALNAVIATIKKEASLYEVNRSAK